jgi:transcriptional regulator with GAF, ATPase, and Fis domain
VLSIDLPPLRERRTDNNITKSAKLLGLTFRTLQYRLEKFGFKKDGEDGQVTSDE